ncbi:MAG TPA: biopolymer transporter ExbD [Longimicrobiales bacterium]
MAISMGGTGKKNIGDINMTPMIDVLLVLLVIFMIVVPQLQRSIDVQLPLEKPQDASSADNTQIVLEIDAQGNMTINTQPVPPGELEQRLREIYSNRPDKVLFVKADGQLTYQDVISAMDAARGAGVTVLGAMLPRD